MFRFPVSFTASVLAASLAVSGPAVAADAQAVSDALVNHFANNGLSLTVGSARSDGDDVVLEGVELGLGGVDENAGMDMVRLQDVSEANGGFLVARIEWPDFTYSEDGMTLEFGGASIENFPVPGLDETDPVRKSLLFERASMGAVRAADGDGDIFSMLSAAIEITPYEPNGIMTYTMDVTGLVADMTKLPDEQARATMAALGYETLSGAITQSGSWDMSDGRLALDALTLIVDDAAALDIRLDMSGYTPQVLQAIQDINRKQTTGEMDEQAMGLAMLGILQQLTFNSARIRLDDASLTGRVIEFVAAQQGLAPTDVVNQAKGLLPFALAQLQNPEFAAKVSAAVSAYLDDPQSLTISAEPAAPVPAAQIMAAGMSAPNTIPDVLGVSVSAND